MGRTPATVVPAGSSAAARTAAWPRPGDVFSMTHPGTSLRVYPPASYKAVLVPALLRACSNLFNTSPRDLTYRLLTPAHRSPPGAPTAISLLEWGIAVGPGAKNARGWTRLPLLARSLLAGAAHRDLDWRADAHHLTGRNCAGHSCRSVMGARPAGPMDFMWTARRHHFHRRGIRPQHPYGDGAVSTTVMCARSWTTANCPSLCGSTVP
jgi:hypothetical protein